MPNPPVYEVITDVSNVLTADAESKKTASHHSARAVIDDDTDTSAVRFAY
jgi:hypothetical protein